MKINLFRLCSGLKVIGYFMILLVVAIISVSYYTVVVVTWAPMLLHGGGPLVSSFLQHRNVPYSGQRCVLKMDHHYVWVVNCVGACNYKFFLLFLLYTFLETTMDTLVLLPNFIGFFSEAMDHSESPGHLAVVFLAFVLNLAFALSLLCFVVMHASLLSSNTPTVEVHEKRGAIRWKYDLGRKKNFEQVFGTNKALWLLPLFSKEDLDNVPALRGLEFPTLLDTDARCLMLGELPYFYLPPAV